MIQGNHTQKSGEGRLGKVKLIDWTYNKFRYPKTYHRRQVRIMVSAQASKIESQMNICTKMLFYRTGGRRYNSIQCRYLDSISFKRVSCQGDSTSVVKWIQHDQWYPDCCSTKVFEFVFWIWANWSHLSISIPVWSCCKLSLSSSLSNQQSLWLAELSLIRRMVYDTSDCVSQ